MLLAMVAWGCETREPAPPPPTTGTPTMPGTGGTRDGGGGVTLDGGGVTLDGGEPTGACVPLGDSPIAPNRLFLELAGLELEPRARTVVAEWTRASCAATPELRVVFHGREDDCSFGRTEELVFVFRDPGELPLSTAASVNVGESENLTIRYQFLGNEFIPSSNFGNCIGSTGILTFEDLDTEAGLKAATFDLDLTSCDGASTAQLGVVGAFELFMPTAWRDECTP